MRITVKGQVTIPLALRERYGLKPGIEVEFVPAEGGVQLKPRNRARRAASTYDRWLAKAAGSAQHGMTTDELMAVTRGEE